MKSVWQNLKEILRPRIPEGSYRLWIAPLTYRKTDGDTIIINCPNQFFASWVQEHYLHLLNDALIQEGHASWKIRLSPAEIAKEAARDQLHLPNFAPSELTRPRFCERFTFNEFVVGDSNRYAFSACWAAANGWDNHSRIIYLHSDAGLGKSHLTQAVGQKILENRADTKLCYLTANEFTTQVVKSIKSGQMDAFVRRYQNDCDVLLLEEVHSFAGRERTQAELALALDYLMDKDKTIIFTGSKLPRKIPSVNDQLRSRLVSGLITSINPPDLPTRKKIIERKAANYGVCLRKEIIEFLAQHLTGDIRRIEGAVIGLVTKSSLLRQTVDMDLAREVVKDLVGEPKAITVATIREMICRHYQLSRDDICSKSRKSSVARPRQMAMFLARRYTESSLEAIGREFNRDHATVLHSVNRIKKQLNESGKLRHQLEFLVDQLEKQQWQN
ncbi:MAG: chromosomal replication initiator protein DnaA [Thermodesulfobacteriota bacterium]|nr:MAG: chromosomal replication initiator protein DnaA [Thermodesulfobacteriota bacterium]